MNYLGISGKDLTPIVKELNQLLCDYHVYYQNLRNFHWNVKGNSFFELHAKFEELYDEARLNIDEIAERILTLRARPISNMSEYLTESNIKEAGNIESDKEMVKVVIDDQAHLISKLRKAIEAAGEAEDEGTLDILGGYLSGLEKNSWMLAAWNSK